MAALAVELTLTQNKRGHGIIAVHGKSHSLKRGQYLDKFTTALENALSGSPEIGKDERRVYWPKVDRQTTRDGAHTRDEERLSVCGPAPKQNAGSAAWFVREAFWNPPVGPEAWSVLKWWRWHAKVVLKHLWRRYFWTDPALGKYWDPFFREREKGSRGRDERARVYPNTAYRPGAVLFAIFWLKLTFVRLFLLAMVPVMTLLLPVSPLLLKIRPIREYFSLSMGDVKLYVDNPGAASTARDELKKAVDEMLRDDRIEDITIVAESFGAVLAYEALLDEGGEIAKLYDKRQNTNEERKKLNLVTIGSALNLVVDMAKHQGTLARFTRPIADSITKRNGAVTSDFLWLDILARFDYVPGGPLAKDVVEASKVHLTKDYGDNDPNQLEQRMVINYDSFLRDHDGYLDNIAMVMPRVIRCINGGQYPWNGIDICANERVESHTRRAAFKFI